MFIAKLETPNFSFLALDETEEGAIFALRRGWHAHLAQYGERVTTTFDEWAEDVQTLELPAGGCARDGEPLDLDHPAPNVTMGRWSNDA